MIYLPPMLFFISDLGNNTGFETSGVCRRADERVGVEARVYLYELVAYFSRFFSFFFFSTLSNQRCGGAVPGGSKRKREEPSGSDML